MKDFFENNCEIVSDLLPLYADRCCSEKTAASVRHHLSVCKQCKKTYNNMKKIRSSIHTTDIPDSLPDFSKLSSRLRHHRLIKTTFVSLALITAVSSALIIAVTHD